MGWGGAEVPCTPVGDAHFMYAIFHATMREETLENNESSRRIISGIRAVSLYEHCYSTLN